MKVSGIGVRMTSGTDGWVRAPRQAREQRLDGGHLGGQIRLGGLGERVPWA